MIQISTGQHIDQVHINIDTIDHLLEHYPLKEDFRIFVDTVEDDHAVRESLEDEYSVLIINIDRKQFDATGDPYELFINQLLRGLRWTELVDGSAIAAHLEQGLKQNV